jgi:tRNA A37 methylthiotransferase MiaB
MIIYPRPNEYKKPRFGFSYNWAMIGAILYNAGCNVIIHDYSCENFNKEEFVSQLQNERIQLVIIEFDSFSLKRSENYHHGQMIARTIKKICPQIRIIAYGYYSCITNQDIPYADITVKKNDISFILFSIHELLQTIPVIQYDNFDSLPYINRSLICTIPYYNKNNHSTLIQTAKGCENSCVFCQRKGWQSKYIAHGDEYAISEFELLRSQNFTNIWIIDENFTFQLARSKNILKELIKHKTTENMKIAISSWANIDNEFLDFASEANIRLISFGIETGNSEILQFYRKNIDLKKAKRLIQYADSIGIFTIGNFILGAPMESMDTINETFSFIRECSFDQVNIKTLDYMIGSELYSTLDANIAKGNTHLFACKEHGLNNFTLEELGNIKRMFLTQYYRDNRIRLIDKTNKFGMPFSQIPPAKPGA